MIVRRYEESDLENVSELAMTTFTEFNGADYYNRSGIQKVLDSWNYLKNEHFHDDMIRTDIFFVAVDSQEKIVGLIRGTKNKINSLFVNGSFHKKGIGRMLVERYETEALSQGSEEIRLESSIFAVSFYEKMDYIRTSDLKNYDGLKVYSMRKDLI